MATRVPIVASWWEELLGLPEPLAAGEDDYLIAASQLYEAEKELRIIALRSVIHQPPACAIFYTFWSSS